MRATSVTVSSATQSAAIPVNQYAGDFKISLGCVISVGADLTYKIQHTFDNIYNSSITPTWFDHCSLVGLITSKDGSYRAPITAVRLNVTNYISGSVTLTIISGGP